MATDAHRLTQTFYPADIAGKKPVQHLSVGVSGIARHFDLLCLTTFLPFSPPLIGQEEIDEVVESLRTGWITTGPKVKRFEEEFSDFAGARSVLALSSGTAAMHVALAALGIGSGDAVITTPMTFCSSVHVIEQVGARPILVDVEPDTLNINPEKD